MSSKLSSQAAAKAAEANEEICRAYQEAFDARVANSSVQLERSRISELEQLWKKAQTDAMLAYSRLTEELIESIDEAKVIELKKGSTAQRG